MSNLTDFVSPGSSQQSNKRWVRPRRVKDAKIYRKPLSSFAGVFIAAHYFISHGLANILFDCIAKRYENEWWE